MAPSPASRDPHLAGEATCLFGAGARGSGGVAEAQGRPGPTGRMTQEEFLVGRHRRPLSIFMLPATFILRIAS